MLVVEGTLFLISKNLVGLSNRLELGFRLYSLVFGNFIGVMLECELEYDNSVSMFRAKSRQTRGFLTFR